jgi:hypothetical protein
MAGTPHGDELAALRRRAEVAERYAAVLADGLVLADEDIGALRARSAELEAQLKERDEALAGIVSSRSWRLTAPLRGLRGRTR